MEQEDLTDSLAADDTVGDEGQLDPTNPDHAFSILEHEFTQVSLSPAIVVKTLL